MKTIFMILAVLVSFAAQAQREPPQDTEYTELDVSTFRNGENEEWFTAPVGTRVFHDGRSTSTTTTTIDKITGSRIERKPLGNGQWERVYDTGEVTVRLAYLADSDLRRLMGRTRHDRSEASRLGESRFATGMSRLQLMQYPSGEQFWLCSIFLPEGSKVEEDRTALEHEVFHCLGWQH